MKTILLATTGMSPAVLTETVWALAQELPPVIPDEVSVITTVSGRTKLDEQLFTPQSPAGRVSSPPVWDALRAAILGRQATSDPRLCFDPSDIIVARKKQGGRKTELDALSDAADHTAFADTIMDELWKHTSKPDTRVIASLAGGYKTMSALMLSTMQLLANPCDRLTHVLVSGGLDQDRSFFFPVKKAQKKHVHLIDIPLIPLRRWFADILKTKPQSYDVLVNQSVEAIRRRGDIDLRIELPPPSAPRYWVKVNGVEHTLTKTQYSYLRFFAERQEQPPFPSAKDIVDPLKTFLSQYLPETAHIDNDLIIKRLSELRKALPHLVSVLPRRDNWKLDLPSANIILH
jgi:CRISPR-associated protein (TIGR02584 family)